ncbi:hypothetical protein BDB00DRAFT_868285 [Zychaea mexicana]|uniref:uncharacterized protein n=1 Tax=Zychaea mexicana TaxID=64656 RepID=UPI0022FE82D0|nr:uncharacterized protein BDB00DRAFT_868285 [Zychaea mexicana]KAI9497684.1 hypothetical protein BDB00DRAFT_868285 [Zychaea mexicana]
MSLSPPVLAVTDHVSQRYADKMLTIAAAYEERLPPSSPSQTTAATLPLPYSPSQMVVATSLPPSSWTLATAATTSLPPPSWTLATAATTSLPPSSP